MNNQTTAQFDTWITRQYNRLKQRIIHNSLFDEDAFQETYLMMRTTLVYKICDKDFETLFIELYKQILSREYSREMRYLHPDPLFFIFLQSEDTETESEERESMIDDIQAKHVDEYVRRNFEADDYLIFHLKYFASLTWKGIMDYTGQSSATIARKLNNVKDGVRQHFSQIGNYPSMAAL